MMHNIVCIQLIFSSIFFNNDIESVSMSLSASDHLWYKSISESMPHSGITIIHSMNMVFHTHKDMNKAEKTPGFH